MVLRRQEGGITHLQDLKLPWFHAERITKGGESLDDGWVLHVGEDTDPTCANLQAQTAAGQISSGSDHLVITSLRCLAVAEVMPTRAGLIFLVPSSMSLLQRPLVAN